MVEYLALERPVVVSDNPDQEQMVEAAAAGLCAPYRPKAFAQAITELLQLPRSERRAMGRRGRAYVLAHRSYADLAREVAGIYDRYLP